uniref:Alkylglycerone-phosphate synthase n=2 Tax=Macrostomum lignano TaxID=282301 RepID=A0A1I8GBL3_9PLAT
LNLKPPSACQTTAKATKSQAAQTRRRQRTAFSNVRSVIPKHRQDLLKWNGWGYQDSQFAVTNQRTLTFTGQRYQLSGSEMPALVEWMEKALGASIDQRSPAKFTRPENIPPPVQVNADFMSAIRQLGLSHSDAGPDRLFRGHGHTLEEMFTLREGMFPRLPDLVVWPTSHREVVELVNLANRCGVVLIPFGGGTSVTGALLCPPGERRMIVSLDTSQMNRILWLDERNLIGRFEAGIIGQDLEARLAELGYCIGHEPDSLEFSSLGGWVATRASGMKKNVYGNIEDLLVHVTFVTPTGVIEKSCAAPRVSVGPDVHHLIMGSEGSLGVVTEVTLKIRPLPQTRRYGSLVFADFASGVRCLRELALRRCAPASVRLMDNEQFQFGHALRPAASGWTTAFVDAVKRFYVTRVRGFKPDELAVATLLYEGTPEEVAQQEALVNSIAANHGGISGGEENGRRGYMLTFVIAYLRDLGLDYYCVGESFETSVPWDRVLDLCRNVKLRIKEECRSRGVTQPVLSTCRVTQTYDAGACVYFYFAYNYRGLPDPVHLYEEVENAARDEILANGGSLSHHHGVGKIRQRWYSRSVSEPAVAAVRAVKSRLDPNNVFACANLFEPAGGPDGQTEQKAKL